MDVHIRVEPDFGSDLCPSDRVERRIRSPRVVPIEPSLRSHFTQHGDSFGYLDSRDSSSSLLFSPMRIGIETYF